jgi:hypothetical protein
MNLYDMRKHLSELVDPFSARGWSNGFSVESEAERQFE